jgi:phage tail tape-measure protein
MNDREREDIGRAVGTGAGIASGAALGSRILPVPILGGFVGGVLGAALGSEVGRRFGKALLRAGEEFVGTIREDLPRPLGPAKADESTTGRYR